MRFFMRRNRLDASCVAPVRDFFEKNVARTGVPGL